MLNIFELAPEFKSRYEIVNQLGKGGVASVFLATAQDENKTPVALKVIPKNPRSGETAERAKREFMVLSKLEHPNIVAVIDFFENSAVTILVMEHLSGGSLSERMKKGISESGEFITNLLLQISSGLATIHDTGAVHRDIKPANILLTEDGSPKISDFGTAQIGEANNLTVDGYMVGTPKYLAPEYIETGECDQRGDIYSLGVIGYELLTGSYPFIGKSQNALLLDRFRPVSMDRSKINSEYPEDLIQTVETAMKTSLSQRYQSARLMNEALKSVANKNYPKLLSPKDKKLGSGAKLLQKLAVFQNL